MNSFRRIRGALVPVVVGVALAAPGTAAASSLSFTVNTTVDSHDAHPGDGLCADSNGLCSLRAAIEESNAQPAGSTVMVTVPSGTYKLQLGGLAITHNTITINGAGSSSTIVQGRSPVVKVSAKVTVALTGLELTRGNAGGLNNSGTTTLNSVTVTANSGKSGAGITNAKGGTLTVISSTVSNNTVTQPADSQAGGSGGGILNSGTLTLTNSTVSGNYAGEGGFGASDTGGTGGGGGGIDNTGTVIATGSAITGNHAGTGGPGYNEVPGDGGGGGGIYSSGGSVTLTNTTVSSNVSGYAGPELTGDGPANAGNGGGVYSSGKLTVTGSTLSANTGATGQGVGSDGGGIYNGGTATISSSTFTSNVAGTGSTTTGDGGAIANLGTLTLTNSTLSGNSAAVGGSAGNGLPGGSGGGLYQGGGTATLTGDTLTGNASGTGGAGSICEPCLDYGGPGGSGGAIYSAATLSVTNSTLSGNMVGVGGADAPPLNGYGPDGIGAGLFVGGASATLMYVTVADNTDGIDNNGGSVTLGGTILADSTGTNDQTAANCTGTILETSGYNLDSGTSCGLSKTTDVTGTEPLLGALASNGGPTQTQALQAGSPAIDHGGTAATGCPATDQRGQTRPDETADNGACDIGAYESAGLA